MTRFELTLFVVMTLAGPLFLAAGRVIGDRLMPDRVAAMALARAEAQAVKAEAQAEAAYARAVELRAEATRLRAEVSRLTAEAGRGGPVSFFNKPSWSSTAAGNSPARKGLTTAAAEAPTWHPDTSGLSRPASGRWWGCRTATAAGAGIPAWVRNVACAWGFSSGRGAR